MQRNATYSLLLALSLLFTLAACGDDHDHDDHDHDHSEHSGDEDPAEEACEHLADGPSVAVSTEVNHTSNIADDHKRYDITITEAGDSPNGVTFEADEAGDFLFFFSKAVTFEIRDSAGAVVSPEATADNPGPCADIVQSYTFELAVGAHTLTFAGAQGDTVSVVIEHAEHEDHDHSGE